MSVQTPAFSISDSLDHMRKIFINVVKPMAGYASAATNFVNTVTDYLVNNSFERVKKRVVTAVEDVVREAVMDKVSAQVSGYGTLGIVAIVGVGIFLAYQ